MSPVSRVVMRQTTNPVARVVMCRVTDPVVRVATNPVARAAMRAVPAVSVVAGLAAVTAGCSSVASPRPLTGPEAERLAAVRLVDYDAGGSRFTSTYTGADGDPVTVAGRIDWKRGLGQAAVSAHGVTLDDLFWQGSMIALHPHRGGRWTTRTLMPASVVLDRVLVAVAEMSGDRPDNPQLLQQDGARWVRGDRLAGTSVDVFRGPSGRASAASPKPPAPSAAVSPTPATQDNVDGAAVYFWVDKDSQLRRFQSSSPNDAFTIDFTSPGPQRIDLPTDVGGQVHR